MDVVSMRRTHWDELVSAMTITLDHRCTHKCRWLIGPWCRGNFCPGHPMGRCGRPPFHDGECMCANCQTDLVYRVSQNVSRCDAFNLLDEHHDETACTHLWAKRYTYIYDKADSPSSASSASSDYCGISPKMKYPAKCCSRTVFWSASSMEAPQDLVLQTLTNPNTPGVSDAVLSKPQTPLASFGTFPRFPARIGNSLAKQTTRAWPSHHAPRTSATENI